MKLEFDPNLEYQITAIDSAIVLFSGQQKIHTNLRFTKTKSPFATVPNKLDLKDGELLRNLNLVQIQNNIAPDYNLKHISKKVKTNIGEQELRFKNFSVEMETGTGKTYIYIRTILELFIHYGFRKFIIVVPSIAIREGVLKTLDITKTHFKEIYGKIPYGYYVYDSSRLSQIRQFALSDSLEIMIMTIDSFNKASNIINQSTDRLQGETPINLIQATRPILILDEPQNMESEISKIALASMNPLFALRYSATHRNPYNIIYRLTPFEAYRQGLVKRIEVASVIAEDSTIQPYILLERIEVKKRTLTAKVKIHKLMKNGTVKEKSITVRPGDSLEEKTGREEYRGYDISEISLAGNYLRFSNNLEISVGQDIGADRDAIFEAQIRYTIEEHFLKQRRLKDSGLKVLSLFFIDRVDNYAKDDGIINVLFNRSFNEIKQNFEAWKDRQPKEVQAAYFAQRRNRQGEIIYEDSKTGESKKDEQAYNLIMKDKELLLSFEEPVSFIFSHSALREGWDNPNIYQICTLNQTVSEIKKRQEVGRGVRLAVNQKGKRVFDQNQNILTVIANESYEKFVKQYQNEIAYEYLEEIEARYGKSLDDLTDEEREKIIEEYGEGIIPPKPSNARAKKIVKLNKAHYLSPEFKEIWDKIKQKTKYSITIDSEKLVREVTNQLEKEEIAPPRVSITKIQVTVDSENVFEALQASSAKSVLSLAGRYPLPNVMDKISNLLEYTSPSVRLTRKTILEIIRNCSEEVQRNMIDNPNEFAFVCTRVIKDKLADQLIDGIQYTKINELYKMTQFTDEFESWTQYLKPASKSVYEEIICNSKIEKDFVDGLERMDEVLLYFKLPSWFTVPTPIGKYNPDWAILWQEKDVHGRPIDKKLYLVYETKSTSNLDELRPDERRKIICGEKHFKDTLKLDEYKVVKSIDEIP